LRSKAVLDSDAERSDLQLLAKLMSRGINPALPPPMERSHGLAIDNDMRKLWIIGLMFLLNLKGYSQVDTFSDKYVDSVVINFKQKWNIPGISVAIAKDGRLIYAKGFGYADIVTGKIGKHQAFSRYQSL